MKLNEADPLPRKKKSGRQRFMHSLQDANQPEHYSY